MSGISTSRMIRSGRFFMGGPEGGGTAVFLFDRVAGIDEFDLHDDAIGGHVVDDQDSPRHAVLIIGCLYAW